MVCSSPITLQSSTGADYKVPCGHCLCCRAAKGKEWALRLKHEQSAWDREGFLTLTYSDVFLPDGGKLVKKDLQNFFKRFRYFLKDRKIRYFACGEYGSRTFRRHFHAIIFGADKRDISMVSKAWPFGDRISFDPVLPGGIEYVCGYVRKKIALQYAIYRDRGLPFPFQLQSKGLGRSWADANHALLAANGLTYQGKAIGIPRYYMQRLDLSSDAYYSDLVCRLDDRDTDLLDRGLSYFDIIDSIHSSERQQGVNALRKKALFSTD